MHLRRMSDMTQQGQHIMGHCCMTISMQGVVLLRTSGFRGRVKELLQQRNGGHDDTHAQAVGHDVYAAEAHGYQSTYHACSASTWDELQDKAGGLNCTVTAVK